MAVDFTRQATRQLAPAYTTQVKALKSQIPAISNKYTALMGALEGEQASANMGAFEDASARGVLRSTIPVDAQQAIAQGILQKRAGYAGDQAAEVGAVRTKIADVGVQRASAIAQLINALRTQALQERQFNQTRALADRQFNMDQQMLNMGF